MSEAVVFPVGPINRDMTGWKCLEPAEVEADEFEPTICEFLLKGESPISGEEMVKRAREQGINDSGLSHAEAMLREQDKIPMECQNHCLVFPEVWQDPDGWRSVFYLYWAGHRWYLLCGRLDDDFDSRRRFVRPRK